LGRPSEIELKKVIFLDPHNCMCCSDAVGNVFFYGIVPSKMKNKKIFEKTYLTTSQTNTNAEKYPVTHIAFNHLLSLLLLVRDYFK
jgi:hypothetical protein